MHRLNELGINRLDASAFYNYVESRVYGKQLFFVRMNLEDKVELPKLFDNFKIDWVCNLAAQAGVRYSIENPMTYIDSNIVGFVNLLECIRNKW